MRALAYLRLMEEAYRWACAGETVPGVPVDPSTREGLLGLLNSERAFGDTLGALEADLANDRHRSVPEFTAAVFNAFQERWRYDAWLWGLEAVGGLAPETLLPLRHRARQWGLAARSVPMSGEAEEALRKAGYVFSGMTPLVRVQLRRASALQDEVSAVLSMTAPGLGCEAFRELDPPPPTQQDQQHRDIPRILPPSEEEVRERLRPAAAEERVAAYTPFGVGPSGEKALRVESLGVDDDNLWNLRVFFDAVPWELDLPYLAVYNRVTEMRLDRKAFEPSAKLSWNLALPCESIPEIGAVLDGLQGVADAVLRATPKEPLLAFVLEPQGSDA
jgi:hypothetical protein